MSDETIENPDSSSNLEQTNTERKTATLAAPLAGTIVNLSDVPDPLFASKSMGDGFAIEPSDNKVVAPADGTIVMVAHTGHAFGIRTHDGVDLLVHMGIDTVELKGTPFDLDIKVGDAVTAGQSVGTMDLDVVRKAGKDTTTMVILTNLDEAGASFTTADGKVELGAPAATLTLPATTTDAQRGTDDDPVIAKAHSSKPDDATGFDALAYDIVDGIGGPGNVKNVLHCITRVRFNLKDESVADDKRIADLDGVIDVIKAGGQYQVVIGPGVEDVYDAVTKVLGGTGDSSGAEEEPVERPTTAIGWFKYGFSSLIGVITGSMIPVIGLLAASGILKGILALLTQFDIVQDNSPTFTFIAAMADSMFFFLPIIVGFTAARRLGSDPIIVAIIGGVMVYPSIVAMSNPDADGYKVIHKLGPLVFNGDFFGIPVAIPEPNAYAYSIFPIIVAAWLAARIEPLLKKYIPVTVRMIFAPLIEVFVVSAIMLVVLGPIIMFLSSGISAGIDGLLSLNHAIAGLIIGGFYQCLVIFGLHWAVIPLVAQQIAQDGSSPLNAIISATMVAQGAGALAIWLKTKSPKVKTLAGPATISAFCGITEPAMYGLNLKYGRVFIMASIGGAAGGLLTGLFNVNMYGFTGAVVGFPSFVNPDGIDAGFIGYAIATLVTIVVSFTLTYFFGYDDKYLETERTVKKVRLGKRTPAGVK